MDPETAPVAEVASERPTRKGLIIALIALLLLGILALLALIGATVLSAVGPGLQGVLLNAQATAQSLQSHALPVWPARVPPTAVSACPEDAVLSYEAKAAALSEKASGSAQAAYTAYTQLIQVNVSYCLATLKGHHVKLFYARYMVARAVDTGNSADAGRYANEMVKYVDFATQERERLAAQNGWGAYH